MHAVFFGTKRAHLEVVWRLTRPILEKSNCGLTPARFDMMRIVHLRPQGVQQSTLQWLLGVSAPTVCRMLKALEQLGMITRRRYYHDGRCWMIHITPTGAAAVKTALAATVDLREDERAVARCATGDVAHYRRGSAAETTAMIDAAKPKTAALTRTLAIMRHALFDFAPFDHPWQAVDCPPLKVHTVVDGVGRYGDEWPLDEDWNPAMFIPGVRPRHPEAPYRYR
jgi:DNA-binding MarR family transcriptional regulator